MSHNWTTIFKTSSKCHTPDILAAAMAEVNEARIRALAANYAVSERVVDAEWYAMETALEGITNAIIELGDAADNEAFKLTVGYFEFVNMREMAAKLAN